MAATIKKVHGIHPKLIPGDGGVLDVSLDGKRIFSKHETGRFPKESEILAQLAGR